MLTNICFVLLRFCGTRPSFGACFLYTVCKSIKGCPFLRVFFDGCCPCSWVCFTFLPLVLFCHFFARFLPVAYVFLRFAYVILCKFAGFSLAACLSIACFLNIGLCLPGASCSLQPVYRAKAFWGSLQ